MCVTCAALRPLTHSKHAPRRGYAFLYALLCAVCVDAKAAPFDFDSLTRLARERAQAPYRAPPETLPSPETLRKAIDWCVLNLRDIKPVAVSDDPCPYVHCAKSLACLSMDVRNPGFFPISKPPGE